MRLGTVLPLAVLLVAAACNGDSGTAPDTDDLPGTWRATKVQYVSVANSSPRVDIAAAGATITLTLNAGGTFLLAAALPGKPAQNLSGTWSASKDVLTMTWSGTPFTGEWQSGTVLAGNALTLTGADTEYDVNGDDQDEPAKLNMTLVRP